MISYTLKQAAAVTGGKYQGDEKSAELTFRDVTIDSRSAVPGCLFVPIIGERFDGHSFIPDAVKNGAAASLTEKDGDYPCPVIRVDSTAEAFKRLAAAHRQAFSIPVIGITGSVGKTTTKEMVASVLSQSFHTLKTQGNFNNQTGVPITLARLDSRHRAAVVEMGTNHFGEMASLTEVVRPTIGVITNIRESHIEFFGSRDGILKEKSEILKYIGTDGWAIINGDDDKLIALKGKYPKMLTYGMAPSNDIHCENIDDMGLAGSRFTACFDGKRLDTTVPAPGRHMVMNAMCAIAVGVALNMEPGAIAEGIAAYVPVGGRMDIVRAKTVTVLSDAYNAGPASMRASIDTACRAEGRTVLILGDMLELGSRGAEYHREIGEHAAAAGADLLLSVGELSKHINSAAEKAGIAALHYQTREDLMAELDKLLRPGDTVLVKASRGMHFEVITDFLIKNF